MVAIEEKKTFDDHPVLKTLSGYETTERVKNSTRRPIHQRIGQIQLRNL